MPRHSGLDRTDARVLLALARAPRATTIALAQRLGLSRNTVHARLAALEQRGALDSFERRIAPAAVGYPLTAFVTTRVVQRQLDAVAAAMSEIPEILQVQGISGESDLLVQVVAADADDLYRIAGQILAVPGVERTTTALVMRQLLPYRVAPLLERQLDEPDDRRP